MAPDGRAARSGSDRWRARGWVLDVALRLIIVAFAVEAVLAGDDPRFIAKGIPARDVVLAGAALALTFPILHVARRSRVPYPLWADCLLLSILALDMGGNSLNLYEQGWRFDLIPHAYGPGAGVAALHLLGAGWLAAALIINGLHIALEVQEALGDVLFQTQNVHGAWDTVTDLAAGLLGSLCVPFMLRRFRNG